MKIEAYFALLIRAYESYAAWQKRATTINNATSNFRIKEYFPSNWTMKTKRKRNSERWKEQQLEVFRGVLCCLALRQHEQPSARLTTTPHSLPQLLTTVCVCVWVCMCLWPLVRPAPDWRNEKLLGKHQIAIGEECLEHSHWIYQYYLWAGNKHTLPIYIKYISTVLLDMH